MMDRPKIFGHLVDNFQMAQWAITQQGGNFVLVPTNNDTVPGFHLVIRDIRAHRTEYPKASFRSNNPPAFRQAFGDTEEFRCYLAEGSVEQILSSLSKAGQAVLS